ncbi:MULTISPECIES: zeta toxin family protein [unclassified Clostridium]|uniref:zeta toxin family protein n=1 Tax=unclassified Clostridium TaxID=2614128 RepID=UPI000E53D303|nr:MULTISPECIES: zeta toxin family protein [unclassified Clostridium]RHP91640.1 adenylylsulfate kinase [Clostridium sp. AM54-37XD]RHP95469.1 adenylylsulfate kinase [Clostridium sp. AM54-14XD]
MDTKEITVLDLAQEQIRNAERLFPLIRKKTEERKEKKTVISVSGGSGVGKTGMAFLLQNMFEKQGKKSLIISGDNYPHRIPMYNDAERIARFRMSGLNGLITERLYTDEVKEKLLELQKAGRDAEEQEDMQWLSIYQKYGDKALTDYLGTDQELDYEAISNLLMQFHGETSQLLLRHMGRTPDDIWYDRRDVSDTDILILEWTHGNSAYLQGVDVSVVLISTPEETLENRKKRNRDTAIDSPFVARVLRIEQKKINDGLDRADIIQDMHGRIYTE